MTSKNSYSRVRKIVGRLPVLTLGIISVAIGGTYWVLKLPSVAPREVAAHGGFEHCKASEHKRLDSTYTSMSLEKIEAPLERLKADYSAISEMLISTKIASGDCQVLEPGELPQFPPGGDTLRVIRTIQKEGVDTPKTYAIVLHHWEVDGFDRIAHELSWLKEHISIRKSQ